MAKRIFTGQAHPSDYLLFLYLLNIKAKKPKPPPEEGNQQVDKDGDGKPKDEDGNQPKDEDGANNSKGQGEEGQNNKKKGDGDAYEDPITNKVKGDLGEAKVKENLIADGYTEIVEVQNNSGHGVDVIARNPKTGAVKCIEVKANTSKLSADQKWGGKKYVNDRLKKAASDSGYNKIPPNPAELRTNAQKAQKWLKDAPQVDYEVHQVPVNNQTGVVGTPKVTPWDPKPPKTK